MPTLPSLSTLALRRPPTPSGSGPLAPLRLRVRRRRLTRLTLGLLLAGLAAAVGALAIPGGRWPPGGAPVPGPPPTGSGYAPPADSDTGADSRPVADTDSTAESGGPTATGPTAGNGTANGATTGRLGLGPGERAVALAPPTAQPPLVEGDQVDLVAVAMGADGMVEARILDVPARVLALDSAGVTVAVPVDDVVAVLRHQGQGPIELVLRP